MKVSKFIVIATCYENSKEFIDQSLNSIKRFAQNFGDIPIANMIYGENTDEPNDVTNKQKIDAFKVGIMLQ